MTIAFEISFTGNDADENVIDFYDAARALVD